MALSFPLSLSNFFDLVPKVQASMTLKSAVLTNRTKSGQVLQSDAGERLWGGTIMSRGNAFLTLDDIVSRVELLLQANASFLIRHPVRIGPANDPQGTILGASTPQITSVSANNRDVTITGLPANYVLRRGDHVSWTYLSNPTRYALHEVVTQATANGSGQMTVELQPPLRPGYLANQPITLVRSVCKAIVLADSYKPPLISSNGIATFSFDWMQTLS